YFHSIRTILSVQNDQFQIKHITGDLHTLEPTELFQGLKSGESIAIPYVGEYWTLFNTDFMPRSYVTVNGLYAQTIASTDFEDPHNYITPISGDNWKRVANDNNILATAKSRFAKNSDTALTPAEGLRVSLIPTPLKTIPRQGSVVISDGVSITDSILADDMYSAVRGQFSGAGLSLEGGYNIALSIAIPSTDLARTGAYKLDIGTNGTTIVGYDQAGVFYGLQSVLALLDGKTLPLVSIEDAPRFDYRAVFIDVARNFHSKETVLRSIEQMAAYKLNKLHLHLTDDEGWRIEIPGLPELTEIGARRCHDLTEQKCLLPQLGSGPAADNSGTGYFTVAEYIEIVSYAKARGIEVIPEIDMPAHARAAVVAMEARYNRLKETNEDSTAAHYRLMDPQDTSNVTTVQFYDKRSFINPCQESAFNFVEKVIGEIASMHRAAGAPLMTWHYGGDEAKNIRLGSGYQSISSSDQVAWKGTIDQANEDKPFAKSPRCQQIIDENMADSLDSLPSYFAEKVSEIAAQHGIVNFQAWQDGLKHSKNADAFATKNTRINFWDTLFWGGGQSAYEWGEKGYDVIVSNPDYVYMDMPYEVDPQERGYYWATRATDTRKIFAFAPENLPQNAETSVDRDGNGFTSMGTEDASIVGLSAQLWSETIHTDDQFEYMVYPRVIAVAERAWHQASWEKPYQAGVKYTAETTYVDKAALLQQWQRFANIMGQREFRRLDKAGINYRIPLPGGNVVHGKLAMNTGFPGLVLEYSTNGENWHAYDDANRPHATNNTLLRTVSPDGKRYSRVIPLQR
ncbi:MAG: family 20 glycosylhydrolase, partial [Gammaproteobacteria bacterium]|nr:family 20 glycosylhydrolase [Gammaproteobacteria bacterium]